MKPVPSRDVSVRATDGDRKSVADLSHPIVAEPAEALDEHTQ